MTQNFIPSPNPTLQKNCQVGSFFVGFLLIQCMCFRSCFPGILFGEKLMFPWFWRCNECINWINHRSMYRQYNSTLDPQNDQTNVKVRVCSLIFHPENVSQNWPMFASSPKSRTPAHSVAGVAIESSLSEEKLSYVFYPAFGNGAK